MTHRILEVLKKIIDASITPVITFGSTHTTIRVENQILKTARDVIETFRQVDLDPFGFVLSINGQLVFKKEMTELESLAYSSIAVYAGNNRLVQASELDSLPHPNVNGELVQALSAIELKDEALKHCLREHGGFTIKGETERVARAALSIKPGDVALVEYAVMFNIGDHAGINYLNDLRKGDIVDGTKLYALRVKK